MLNMKTSPGITPTSAEAEALALNRSRATLWRDAVVTALRNGVKAHEAIDTADEVVLSYHNHFNRDAHFTTSLSVVQRTFPNTISMKVMVTQFGGPDRTGTITDVLPINHPYTGEPKVGVKFDDPQDDQEEESSVQVLVRDCKVQFSALMGLETSDA
jgi:hypothetical protein